MFERLKICWLVLTKKHYVVFFYDKKEEGKSGVACYIDEDSERDEWFLGVCMSYWKSVIDSFKFVDNLKKKIRKESKPLYP